MAVFRHARCFLCVLSLLSLAGCQTQPHPGVMCRVGAATLWLQPNGRFVQDYTYTSYLLNPADQNPPTVSAVHEGYWQLLLPGHGSPDGQAYVLLQNMYLGPTGPAPGTSPAGYEQDKTVPLAEISAAKGALTAEQLHALAASNDYHPKPLPQSPPPVITIGPPR